MECILVFSLGRVLEVERDIEEPVEESGVHGSAVVEEDTVDFLD